MAVDVPLVEPDESMEEEEVLACSFEPPGRGVNVSGVEAFRIHVPSHASRPRPDDAASNGSWGSGGDSDEDPSGSFDFPALEEQVRSAIQRLNGQVLPKLNWSAPKDARWIHGTLKCCNPSEAFELQPAVRVMTEGAKMKTRCQVGSKWKFRTFIRDGRLMAISQRQTSGFFEHLLKEDEVEEIKTAIRNFFEEKVRGRFPLRRYVMDLYVDIPPRRKVWLVDFSPWGPTTEPLLFDWSELRAELRASREEEEDPVLRVVRDQSECHGKLESFHQVPLELAELNSQEGLNEATISASAAAVDGPDEAYKYEEYSADSETDRTRSELQTLGLPDGKDDRTRPNTPKGTDFTTQDGKMKWWVWSPAGCHVRVRARVGEVATVLNSKEDDLMQLLQKHGIDISEFTWQSFAELYTEAELGLHWWSDNGVYEESLSTVDVEEDQLVRRVSIVKVWLEANVFNEKHVLVIKTKQQRGRTQNFRKLRTLSMRMRSLQTWNEAVAEALFLRLGISAQQQQETLHIYLLETREEAARFARFGGVEFSVSFPGLKTVYTISEVQCEILNPQDQRWQSIGLPAANDFTFSRQEPIAKTGEFDTVITRWGWTNSAEVEQLWPHGICMKRTAKDTGSQGPMQRDPGPCPFDGAPIARVDSNDLLQKKVPAETAVVPPEPLPVSGAFRELLEQVVISLSGKLWQLWDQTSHLLSCGKDELLIMRVMDGKQTDWARARRAAEHIRSANYNTKDFYEDLVAAFPELRLYCVVRENGGHGVLLPSLSTLTTSASRTGEDEYQRTIGALFCIFWLMRTHLDGKESFCFGLDDDWRPRNKTHFKDGAEYKKRKLFYEKTDWAAIEALFVLGPSASVGAGLLHKAGGAHDIDRTLAMLVLMTIHDVMKLDILRPTVGCGEFSGYRNGEPIGDHDLALSYVPWPGDVLDRCPQALPSFAGLAPAMQESIKFTHCKLDYNMGWLVQAEAPPGARGPSEAGCRTDVEDGGSGWMPNDALFKAFRQVVLAGAASDRKSASDIAFYFVHWFSDLAGAEAFPLQGCEKFVLKFPLHVLSSFIDSFAVVWNLGPKTETEVFEDYLVWRWNHMSTKMGTTPSGTGAIAKMRLVGVAQSGQTAGGRVPSQTAWLCPSSPSAQSGLHMWWVWVHGQTPPDPERSSRVRS
ncbi:Cell division cycle protein 123 homolog [Durusdinium trenchii]|uniref:Cell division cycle protein 123 homolog n=1 Tax=Durusdinium trenchii TaxID=1381693 RepID=A0ABP0KG04_9DINO